LFGEEMNDEISQNGGERVQKWLHESYNDSYYDIHSTKSFEFIQTSKNSMVTVISQRPMVAGSVGDKTYLNDVSKLLPRQALGIDLLKFDGDVKKLPTFITTHRKTTKDCDCFESENMKHLQKCLLEPARNCVRMILLTNNAEKLLRCLKRIMVGLTRSSNS
jgi:hypothetical protein